MNELKIPPLAICMFLFHSKRGERMWEQLGRGHGEKFYPDLQNKYLACSPTVIHG